MDVDPKEIENLERVLKTFSKVAAPIAFQQAINETVAKTRYIAQYNIKEQFTTRNKWSERSVFYKRATGLNVDKMQGEVGSAMEYMADQEAGFTRTATGKHGIQIPRPAAAGESGNTRTRAVLRRNQRRVVKLHKSNVRHGSETQQASAEIQASVASGVRFWYGELRGKSGMWQIRGSVRKKGKGWLRGLTIRKLYTADQRSITTPKTEWLQPAGEKALKKFDEVYFKKLNLQLDRLKTKG